MIVAMKVLVTNIEMLHRSGTTLYVRDLALELLRQGHEPTVYTLGIGVAAAELLEAGVPVVTRLRQVQTVPDIIHGHHNLVTRDALRHFVNTPAIFVCHDHTSVFDVPPLHRHIQRYFAVSNVCRDRVRESGIPDENIRLLSNFVDFRRFFLRSPLPDKPRRALLFSNYASDSTQLPAVKEACRRANLELDVVGLGVGRPVEKPEEILGNYDIVFAKAKSAMEAMAVGTAVILCDFAGVGPMVTSSEFGTLQPHNFGFKALCYPLEPEFLLQQIERYDADDARIVSDLIRVTHGLDRAVKHLVSTYREAIASFSLIQYIEPHTQHHCKDMLVAFLLKSNFSLERYKHYLRRMRGFHILKRYYREILSRISIPQ